jgi:arsenite/tail-anchored protein-transporting ATPase
MRIILFTGKGGVGKTSLSAATALQAAARGRRTVLISTDSAHSLSDILEIPLTGVPQEITKNLDALEIDADREMEAHWDEIKQFISRFFSYHGLDELISEELSVLPGMEEIFSLLKIAEYKQNGTYDCCIVDCAPTGSTLRLLSLPEIINWYLDHIFPLQRAFWGIARPVASHVTAMPLPDDELFKTLKSFYISIGQMRDCMIGRDTSIRLVMNPEKMVVREAQRAYTYFCLYGFSVDAVMVNRIFPTELEDNYFVTWKRLQREYLEFIEEAFHPLPIYQTPLFDREIVGIPLLLELGQRTYKESDPAALFYEGKSFSMTKKGNRYALTIALPFVTKEKLDLLHRGDELIVMAGSYRRNIMLPESLRGTLVENAKMDDGSLTIIFKREKGEESHGKKKKK